MNLLQEIYVIFRKEMLVWVKNPMVPVVRALVFPLMWIVIFGTAFSGTVENIPVALVQLDFGDHADGFISTLNSQKTLDITTTTNYAKANKMLIERKVYGVVFIPPDFSEKLEKGKSSEIQLSIDETAPQISGSLTSYVTESADAYSKDIAVAYLKNRGINTEIINSVPVKRNTLFGRGIEYLDFLAPGVVMMTIVFSAIFSGGLGMIMDREFGTLKMLMASPVSRSAIILGKTFAGVIQSITSGVVALIFALAMGVHLKTGFTGFILMVLLMFLTSFGFIGMSTALGTRITQLEQFMVVMQILIMPMWFLSGGLYPLESMPYWMKPLACINPLTYATDAMRSVMIRGIIWKTLALDISIILAFAVMMFVVGSLSFRRTIE
ncbi:MAG: ABC transporter permease [Candidatus Hydrothermarchaeaceae archaeon]